MSGRHLRLLLHCGSTDRRHPIQQLTDTILVVDDDDNARRLVVRFLDDAGYQVLDAGGPLTALELVPGHANRIGLLLTDIRMPRMSGIELASRFRAAVPAARVLLMSGYHDHTEIADPLLQKPFTPGELLDAVAAALAPA